MNSYTRFARGARHNSNRGRSASGGRYLRSRPSGGRGGFAAREHIDAARFVKQASESSAVPDAAIIHRFDDFSLSPILGINIKKAGYITPTPIQDQAIGPILEGRDVIGLANTGSGKTAAYLLPIIEKILADNRRKALVIAPTRELAMQIDGDFRNLSKGTGVPSAVLVGGLPLRPQALQLRNNPNLIIGTPGRLKDFCQRRFINLSSFGTVVLDEVDRMLDMGFINDIREIIGQLPAQRQSLFFSATMPERIKAMAGQFLRTPITIAIRSNQSADNVDQKVIKTNNAFEKLEELKKLLATPGMDKVLIFSETKRSVDRLCEELRREGFKVESIHGNKRMNQRQMALSLFKENKINVLVATDVAARGLDIKNVTHVINYTVPRTYDDYIHRVGRTGRANCHGTAYTFA
jgi:superfamily II DNA/RNA helicase